MSHHRSGIALGHGDWDNSGVNNFRSPRSRLASSPALRCCALVALMCAGILPSRAAETPAPPASPLRSLVAQLAQRQPAPVNGATVRKEDLLLPEFRFKPAPSWLFLPELAQALGTNPEERAAVLQLLETSAGEARRLLAAEGADNDVAAATALFMSQLWQVARATELPEAHVDALHAQIVAAIRGAEVAKMSARDKQRYWEFCIGYPVFILGMAEIIEGEEQLADLRKAAGLGFESLLGVSPDLVDIGPAGLVVRAGVEKALSEMEQETQVPAAPPKSPPAPAPVKPSAGVSAIRYTAPAGWRREELGWATAFRATLGDVLEDGKPDPRGTGQHQGSIFVLPPRDAAGGAHATFDAVWREQFDAFDLGDTLVHYRSRLKSGLVIHYMGRFFRRKDASDNDLRTYAVLYLVDLGGGRVQPITGVAVPFDAGLGMGSFKETAAYTALAWPLSALLDSVTPARGAAPYPSGGYFTPTDFHGRWEQSSRVFGGFYTNAYTGLSAGVATHASSGHLDLTPHGTYDYAFGYSTHNPQFGTSAGSEKHAGRYTLDGDILLTEASQPVAHPLRRCAVGIGTRKTANGTKRILVLVGADSSGTFRAPPVVPNGESYSGVMDWYVEK